MALLLSSCGTVVIKDQEDCGDMGSLGATCFHTLSSETRDIPKAQWDDERFGMVCTKASNIADTKAAIEKLCSVSNDCTYEVKQRIDAFYNHIDQIQTVQLP